MLHLLEPTDPRWVEVVAQDLSGLLADHAHCELKAAQSALAIVGRFGADAPELVDPLTTLAREETQHFRQVHEHLVARGVISRGELDMALAVLPRFEGKLGDTLVALELVEPVVLFRQIAEQVRERLLDLFTWESGTAELYRGAGLPPSVGGFPLDLDVWEILRAGVDRRLDAGLEEARFKGHLLDDLERVRQLPSFVQEDALPDELRELLARTATPCPLPELVDSLSRPKDLRRGYRAAALALALDLVAWRH